jgi:hypothetical protein
MRSSGICVIRIDTIVVVLRMVRLLLLLFWFVVILGPIQRRRDCRGATIDWDGTHRCAVATTTTTGSTTTAETIPK